MIKKLIEKIFYYAMSFAAAFAIFMAVIFILFPVFGINLYWKIDSGDNWQDKEVFAYNSAYNYEKQNGDSLLIRIEKGAKTEALEELMVLLDNTPDILVNECDSIMLANQPINELIDYKGDSEKEIRSLSVSRSIYLNEDFITKDIVAHELSHLYDMNHSGFSSQSQFWELTKLDSFDKLLAESEADPYNICESWAILSTFFWNDPDLTNKICPEIYSYFEGIYS